MALIFPAPAQIKNLLDPTANTDAATKQYVDGAVSGGASTNFTADTVTANTITITSNIVANNATTSNLGNLVIANYFTGSGNNLSNIQAANITGTVANANYAVNANYAAYAGNITIAAQSNITSVGTLTSLAVTGNIASGNANLGNVVTANYFIGNGSLLTGISASGGNSNYANYAGNVITSSQPNITSVGTLTSLSVSGDTTLTGNLIVTGNTTYVNSNVTYIDDPMIELGGGANGAALSSNDSMDRGTLLHYYTSTAVNAFMGWKSANNEFVFASNASVNNNVATINTLGNIRAGNANLGNAVVANFFIGSGNNLSNIQGSNVTGNVSSANTANVANYGVVTTQTSGTFYPVFVSGNTTGNYALASNSSISYDVASGALTVGNITAGSGTGGNITGANLISANYLTGTLTTASQPNIISVGTLSSLVVTGNITSGNANLGNLVTSNYFTGNGSLLASITGANVTGFVPNANVANTAYAVSGSNVSGQVANALVASTVYTNAQPNITSVGTLSSLAVTGNITSGNANLGNAVIANYFIGSGNNLSNIQSSNIVGQVQNAIIAGTVYTSDQPNITSVGTLTSLNVSGLLTATGTGIKVANIQDSTGNVTITTKYNSVSGDVGIAGNLTVGTSGTGNVTANYYYGNGSTLTGVASATNSNYANYAGNIVNASQPNITSVGTLSSLAVTGNITSGNANLGNAVNANYFIGSGNNLSNIQGANVNGTVGLANLSTHSNVTTQTSGILYPVFVNDVTTGNYALASNASISYDVANATLTTGSIVAGSGTGGNITGANLISANYLTGTLTTSAQPNITSVGTLSSLTVTANAGVGNLNTGGIVNVTNTTQATGTSTGALIVQGGASITKDLYVGGNIYVPNLISTNSTTLNVQDPLLYLAANTPYPYSYDIGFYSHFATASGSGAGNGYQHTGFVRNHGDNAWYLFSNLSEPSGATIDLSNANIVYDSVKVGNITSLNANLGNAVNANYFIGSGNNLSNIQGSNVSGQVGNALVAGTVYTNAQPNITSLGTLTGITATGTVNLTSASNVSLGTVANVKVTGGSSGQYLQTDGSGNLSWVSLSISPSSISNGNSNVAIATANGNVTIGAVGNNVVTVTGTGVNVSGTINATGNITGNYFIGNGSQLTGITANYANFAGDVVNASQPNITSVGTLTSLAVTGNITSGNANLGNLVTANFFSGSGNLLSNIQASNITGTVANANYSVYSGTASTANAVAGANVSGQVSNALVAGTVYTNSQPNITSLGTLSSLTVSGLITATGAGIKVANVQDSSGTITITTKYNGNTGDVGIAGNLTVGTSGSGNIYANYFIGDGSQLTGITVTSANFANYAGNVTVASQPNITSVGTLSSLAVTGNITSGNANLGNLVTANYFTGNGSLLTGVARATAADSVANGNSNVNIPSSNGNIAMSVSGNSNVVVITGTGVNVSGYTTVTGNITAGNANLGNAVVANFFIGSGNNLSNIQGANVTGAVGIATYATTANAVAGANVSGQVSNALVAGTVYTNAQPNITSVGNLTTLIVGNATANTTMGNGTITATGNISFTGANVSLGDASNVKITGGTSGYYLQTDGAGNLTWAAASGGGGGGGTSLVNGNSNVVVGANSNVSVSVNGTSNVLVLSNNLANVKGNVSANYFIGNGTLLTGIDLLTVAGSDQANYISNGTSNINTPILNGNITVGIGGTSNTVIFTSTGVNVAGYLTVGGVSNLGNISNVKITGGSANYVMVTNGSGGLSWAPASAVYVDNFTGTGTQTTFGPLSATPTAISQTIVNYNGVIQLRSAYTLSGANIVFSSPPAFGALVEVTTIGVTAVVGTSGGSGPTSYIQNGNSNVVVNTNSSIVFSANGNYSIASFLDTGSFINTAVTFSSTANLGPASNVIITGGTSGYVLSTDGLGNLNWVAQTGGSGGSGTGYSLANGTSNLFIDTDSSIYLSANGVANIVTFLDTGSFVNTAISFTNKSNLGPASNVKITGGTSGYYLQTDGTGNLTWAAGGTGYNISNGNSNVTVTGNSAVNISANGVANVVSILDTTSYVNSNLTMTKVTTLGSNANVKITGGTNGQVLSTDGTGNLSWTSAAGGSASTIYVDNFTGTGLQTTFGPLSATPSSVNQTTINYNGVLQLRSSYSLSGANIVFSAPPAYGATIEITTITAGSINVTTSAIAKSLVMSILFGG